MKDLRSPIIGVLGMLLGAALLSLFHDHTEQAVLAEKVRQLEKAQEYYHGDRPEALK